MKSTKASATTASTRWSTRWPGIVLLAIALAACSPKAPTVEQVVERGSLRYLPRESVGLAVVEVRALRDREGATRWLQDLSSKLGGADALARIRALAGPDTLEKIDRIALAVVPQAGGELGYAVLAEGKFEEEKVRSLTGGEEILTLVEVKGQPDVSLTVTPGGQPAIGPRGILAQVREAVKKSDAGLRRSSLMGILKKVEPTSQIWGAIDYQPLVKLARGALGSTATPALPIPKEGTGTLRAVAFQGVIDEAIRFDIVGQADAETGARQLSDALRGIVALARMSASQGQAKDWLEFLDGVRIDQAGDEIRLHGTLTETMARSLSERIPAQGARRP